VAEGEALLDILITVSQSCRKVDVECYDNQRYLDIFEPNGTELASSMRIHDDC